MAKSKNHTSHNQSNKAHRNGACRVVQQPNHIRAASLLRAARCSYAVAARRARSGSARHSLCAAARALGFVGCSPVLLSGIKKAPKQRYSSTKGVRPQRAPDRRLRCRTLRGVLPPSPPRRCRSRHSRTAAHLPPPPRRGRELGALPSHRSCDTASPVLTRPALLQMEPKFLRNQKFSKKGNVKAPKA